MKKQNHKAETAYNSKNVQITEVEDVTSAAPSPVKFVVKIRTIKIIDTSATQNRSKNHPNQYPTWLNPSIVKNCYKKSIIFRLKFTIVTLHHAFNYCDLSYLDPCSSKIIQ